MQLELLDEAWAPIPEAPVYEVSTWGRVRRGEFLVASWANHKGYHLVSIEIDTVPRLRYVHRLVLGAFRGAAGGRVGNHENARKGDNRLLNLAWTTPAGNAAHAAALGLLARPPRTHCREGHPRDARSSGLRQWRCDRCRRALRHRQRSARGGFGSLLELLSAS